MKSHTFLFSIFHPLLYVLVLIFFAGALQAQKKTDNSFMLLWYKGKKINDSTLLKTTGEKVNYSPSQAMINITYPTGKDPFTNFHNEAGKSEESKMKMDQIMVGSESSPNPPGQVVAANEAFDQAVNDVLALAENHLRLDPPVLEATMQEKITRFKNWPPDISEYYNSVLNYVQHPDPETLTTVVPPSYSFDYCFPCDANRKAAYSRDSAAFINNFLAKENLNMARATSVLAYMQKQNAKAGPDSLFSLEIRTQMYEAMVTIAKKIEEKLINVWNKYQTDPAKVPFLVGLLLKMAHIHDLMGFEEVNGFPNTGILAERLATAVKDIIQKAKVERDYTILLNIRSIIYLLRYTECLGLSAEEFKQGIEDYLKLNQFKVTVDADAKIRKEEITELARLNFEGPFNAFPDSTCRLKWYPHGMDSAKGIVFNLKEILLNTPQGQATYTGTREFASKRPWLKLDFCDINRDTAFFYPFFPYKGQDTWTVGQIKNLPMQVVQTVFMTCFMDAAGLKKRAMSLNQSSVEQQMTSVYQQKVVPNTGNLNMNPSTMKPKDYERAAELMDAADEMIHITWYNSLYYFPLKGQLKNHQKLVFDEMLDGKQISQFPNIEFATFKVKIEHIEE
ncbi:MAG: hypothetical protein ACJ748_16605 [Flavisolibacter sp.]